MIATSVLWSIGQLARSQDPVLFTIGHVFETNYIATIMYVLLAFPTGRLDGAFTRGIALAIFVLAGAFEALYVLLGGRPLGRSRLRHVGSVAMHRRCVVVEPEEHRHEQ